MRRKLAAVSLPGLPAAVALAVGLAGAPAAAQERGLAPLQREIHRLAEPARGKVGVGAIHLETGREVYVRAHERFPMASSYKVPIAIQLLTRVEAGEISLDDRTELSPGDLHPGSGILSALFDDPGVVLSVRNLLELTLLISDNSATDLVLRHAGGAAAVTARMAALGFEGIRVDRPTRLLIGDYYGLEGIGADADVTLAEFNRMAEALGENKRRKARRRFDSDPRDTATPRDMARLLAGLWRREILGDESSELLLDIMARSTTGAGRIRGFLTDDAWVAHKTGTIGGTTNDVGIVALPGGAGHVVIVVFVRESGAEVPERERVIAHIARAIHDYFVFVL